jgi:GT2 family glycosyltransferase
MQLLVLGMHRSGSSVLARLLNMMGIYIGAEEALMLPQLDNSSGFWERQDIADINDYLLKAVGAQWDQPTSLSGLNDRFPNGDQLVKDIVHRMDAHRPWAIKDPRCCLTSDIWMAELESPCLIYIHRPPILIAKSLLKRNGMSIDYGLALWEFYACHALRLMVKQAHIIVDSESLLLDPVNQLDRIREYLLARGVTGLRQPSFAEIFSFIDPDKIQQVVGNTELALTTFQSELNDILSADFISPDNIDERFLQPTVASVHILQQGSLSDDVGDKPILMHYSAFQDIYKQQEAMAIEIDRLSMEVERANAVRNVVSKYVKRMSSIFKSINERVAMLSGIVRLSPDSGQPKNKFYLFVDLLRFAVRNPRRAIKLLSWHRAKALVRGFRGSKTTHLSEVLSTRMEVFDPLRRYSNISYSLDKYLQAENINLLAVAATESITVTIIVPVYNEWIHTKNCLDSIAKNSDEVVYEVILADDLSDDETETEAKLVKNLRYIRNSINLRFVKNCNAAVAEAKGKYVLLLNNDTLVLSGWLQSMLDCFEQNHNVGLVGPKLLFDDGRVQEAGGIVWKDASGWNYGRGMESNRPEFNYVKEVDFISGACIMLLKSDWDELGGFDERYAPAYYEDTDLAFRIRGLGKRVLYQPLAEVVHFEGVSHGTDLNSGMKAHQVHNKEVFYHRWKTVLEKQHYENGVDVFRARDRSYNKKTILVIDHYVPYYDRDAGSRSTFQYLQLFVELGHKVIFMPDNFYSEEPYAGTLRKLGIELLTGHWYAENWQVWLRDSVQYIDCIYLHRPHISELYIDVINQMTPRPRVVYFGHDLHYLRKSREAEVFDSKALGKEAADWKRRELALFKKVDLVIYPSVIEVEEVKPYCNHVQVIPLNIYPSIEKFSTVEGRKQLLFIGGFGHPPNTDGLIWFVSQVLPLINKVDPSIELKVVGSNASEQIKSLASDSVEILGRLSDEELSLLYETIRVAVVPLRFGAGIKGKVIEAMYNGVPVVTTSIGAEGLPCNSDYLLCCDEPKEFADAVLSLYTNDDQWRNKVEAGFAAVGKYFSRDTAVKALDNFFS